jgi:hypothetical protein
MSSWDMVMPQFQITLTAVLKAIRQACTEKNNVLATLKLEVSESILLISSVEANAPSDKCNIGHEPCNG